MPHKESENGWLSVTEVLSLTIDKPFLRYWYGKNGTPKCEQIKRESQKLGTEVHELIEYKFKEDERKGTNNSNRMVQNFWNKFVIPYGVKPLALEVTQKDEKLKLQGTFDAIIETNKGIVIADWKTSNSLDRISVPLQLSMYAHLEKLTDYGIIANGVAVRIDKESDAVQVMWYDDLKKYNPIWKAALKLAKFIKWGIDA